MLFQAQRTQSTPLAGTLATRDPRHLDFLTSSWHFKRNDTTSTLLRGRERKKASPSEVLHYFRRISHNWTSRWCLLLGIGTPSLEINRLSGNTTWMLHHDSPSCRCPDRHQDGETSMSSPEFSTTEGFSFHLIIGGCP